MGHDGNQSINELCLVLRLDLDDVGVPAVQKVAAVGVRHRLLERLQIFSPMLVFFFSKLFSVTFPMKFLRFLSSTGGTPTTTERPLAASRGVISTSGREEDFLKSVTKKYHKSNTRKVSQKFVTPGRRTRDIGCKEKVRKVGDCVRPTQVLQALFSLMVCLFRGIVNVGWVLNLISGEYIPEH